MKSKTEIRPVALVTGASRGIGAAIARQLAAEGYLVALNYRGHSAEAEALAGEIGASGGEVAIFQADIVDEAAVKKLFAEVKNTWGNVTALVNNASVNPREGDGSVEQMSLSTFAQAFDVNVTGAFLCCREAIAHMRQAGGGAIVNMGSEAGRAGGFRMTPYAASKAALHTFTVGLAREVAELGIRVNALSPGVIDTHVHENASEERRQHLMNSLPMKRMGTPEEVAQAAVWLLSDKASYITGSILPITGGR